ncbi:NtaA/DmoA family FMN-dependent monooxygenase [Sphaerisporangium sp. NPDC051017]|uniref:NtaA/DmoA family FMN-dependent monooxygenase n=1 Tax=Sphaerisporangium sp. NPDC051017 TaxID=3154636 RepID=UPI003440045E
MTDRPLFLTARINPAGGLQARSIDDAPAGAAELFSPDHWVDLAETARSGRFAAVFLADQPQLRLVSDQLPEYTVDPLLLAAVITSRVPEISVVVTASANYNQPYTLARQFASAHLLSDGRVGWNAVASLDPGVAANFGGPVVDHDHRYERAAEFLDLVHRLFGSWRYPWRTRDGWGEIDPVDWQGRYFAVAGPLNVPLPPYGPPVQVQAGGSPAGVDLAARFADVVYAIAHDRGYAADFRGRLRELAARHGRRDAPLVAPLINPVVVADEAQRQRATDDLVRSGGPIEEQVARLADRLGRRLDGLDLDEPIVIDDLESHRPGRPVPQGVAASLQDLVRRQRPTLKEALAASTTALIDTPERIAAYLIDWWRSGAADGFTINTIAGTDNLRDVVEQVVPLLQDKGVYPRAYPDTNLRANLGLG